MWKPFFIWNGETSYSRGVEVLTLPPLTRPTERVETITIPGRSGTLHFAENNYESYTVSVEVALINTPVDKIFNWLKGIGEITFSHEPHRKQEARIVNNISLEQMIRAIRRGLVQFELQPYKYELTQQPVTLTAHSSITNIGSVFAEPIIQIFGSGDVTVRVNGRPFTVRGVTDYAIVDSRMLCAYRAANELMNQRMEGEFPVFDEGVNAIDWTGNVARLEILPYWRWL